MSTITKESHSPKKQQEKTNYTVPFLIMVFLFFIVGFLTVVNQQLQGPLKDVFDLNNLQTTLVTFSFFLAYPIMGTPAGKLVDKYGYKGTLIIALGILALAMLSFLGAAYLESFGIFLVASFIVGAALTTLQVVINPYISVLGPAESAASRLNLAGGINSLGTVLAPIFVTAVIFGSDVVHVDAVYMPYIFLTVTTLIIAFVVSRLHLPEIAGTTAKNDEGEGKVEGSAWKFRHLVLGIVAIFFYVGVEVAVGANLTLFITGDLSANATFMDAVASLPSILGGGTTLIAFAATMTSLYWGGLMVGRLLSGSVLKGIDGRKLLIIAVSSAIVLCGIGLVTEGIVSVGAFVLMGLFHSVMWPCIFTLAIKDLGPHTSQGSGLLMIGVFGGAVLPLLQGGLADMLGGFHMTYFIVLVGELYILYYALVGCKVIKKK
ncbi:sugar MFS transporter [Aureibacter tunicatorum]|uniref:FHS family L-fucose permease-like MFS transporter n=1 Tax=Aureibacter tunicatorum TaxID=866807 RepID=A0AAE3XRA5_9BACT|nr:sugar MFS transporter [Aureibacter tunicatorum]MDR6241697.1 FHS family L-fucose permease-like MFS transporter [Aureibacter tunicatorum]BDD07318.1 glucose transporter [Aureibacter tunicatorum]